MRSFFNVYRTSLGLETAILCLFNIKFHNNHTDLKWQFENLYLKKN